MRKKVVFLPYDFDTAIGINNEGSLVFSYNLEDIDHTESGADIFNGQQSVLWKNLREMFPDELRTMYQQLRSTGALSYAKVEKAFEDHQAKWPEAIFNEDAWFKYLAPLEEKGSEAYLAMLQGSKAEQRKWWLYNRFRYMDSKYNAGDSLTDVITLRGYAKSNIDITPYADIYATVKFGSYLVQTRANHGETYEVVCPLDNVNDTEIYIYSASQLADVGDLSGLKVGFAEFVYATKLQRLKLGDASSSYSNGNLNTLYLGNNTLLKTLDVRNCVGLGTGDQKTVDLSGCTGIEEVYFDGTQITGVSLPNGGVLKKLHLPGTITSLAILNQTGITDFTCPDTSNISTLRLENVPQSFNTMGIVNSIAPGSRIRLFNFHWELPDLEGLATMLDRLDTMRGLDQNGNNTEKPQLYGSINVPYATGDVMYQCRQRYPDVTFTYDHVTATIYYHNRDSIISQETVIDGANPTNVPRPTYSDAQYYYTFTGWSSSNNDIAEEDILRGVEIDKHVYAAYDNVIRKYTVRFFNGTTLLATFENVPYGTTVEFNTIPEYYEPEDSVDWNFIGWTNDATTTPITGNTDCYSDWRYVGYYYKKYLAGSLAEYDDTDGLITYVGEKALYGYATLKKISLPAAESVFAYAFQNCSELREISLPNVLTVNGNAFAGCSQNVQSAVLNLPRTTNFADSALASSGFTEINLPELVSVPQYMFRMNYKLEHVSLPKASTLGYAAFELCQVLEELSLPRLASIPKYAFLNCRACTSFNLPLVEEVGEQAFENCNAVTRLNLPRARKLATKAFNNMPALKWLRIGGIASDNLLKYASVFNNSNALETIILDGVTAVPEILITTFNGSAVAAETCYIYVPANMVAAFQASENWSTYANQIRAIEDYPDLYDEGGDE